MIASKLIKVDDAINQWDMLTRLNKNRPALEIERTLGGTQINRKYGRLICVDRDEMEPIPGAVFIQGDMRDEATYDGIKRILASNEVDVVLSDMAPDTTGERETNHIRIMELAEEALEVCQRVMRNGGTFVCKVFSGAEEADFRDGLKKQFTKVRAFRPAASRKVSPEMYYVAQGFVPHHLRVRDVSSQPRTHLYEDVGGV